MKRVAIDTVTIHAGHGGSGGGIWTYTKQLLLHLDHLAPEYPDLEFLCFVNSAFDIPLQNIHLVPVAADTRKLPQRMRYLHITLPALCRKLRVNLLHRLTPEIPYRIQTPVVCTLHDFMAEFYERTGKNAGAGFIERLRNRYFFSTKKFALHHSKAVCTPSHAIKKEAIEQFGGDPDRVCVTELAAQQPASNYKRKDEKEGPINFYTIAAFHPHKGHLQTIAVFEALLKQTAMDAYLCLRGNVQDEAAFAAVRQRISQSPAKERIRVIPFDRNSSLADIYSDANFLILLSEYEGFGLPVLEAQAFGIPLVCSNIPTFQEVAGDSAFYLDAAQPASAAARLAQLVNDKSLQEALVKKGLQNTLRFSWSNTASKTIGVYRHCLGAHPSAKQVLQKAAS